MKLANRMIDNREGYIQDVVLTRVVNHISSPSRSHLLQATLLHSELHIFRFVSFNSSTEYIFIKTLQAFGAWLSDNLFVLLTTAVVDAVLENDSKTDVAWMLLSDVGQTLQ